MSAPISVYLTALVPCVMIWSAVAAWEYHTDQWVIPSRREWAALLGWAVGDLRDDYERAAEAGLLRRSAVGAVEAVLAPVLVVRAGIHAWGVWLASPGAAPEMTVGLATDPIQSDRQLWSQLTCALAVAILGVWLVQMYPTGALGISGAKRLLFDVWTVGLGAVLVGDPLVQLLDYTSYA